jgi:hypothetical protein
MASYVTSGDEFGDDYMGDEIVGDDFGDEFGDDIVGDELSRMLTVAGADPRRAALQRGQQRRFPVRAGVNAMVNARAIEYKPFIPRKVREFVLGFDSGAPIAAGAQQAITALPQVPFKGTRLVVPSDIAGLFLLNDLRVGKNSQFVSAGAVPARTFAENGVSVTLALDTAQVSQQIVISVTNFSGGPARFVASLIGTAVEQLGISGRALQGHVRLWSLPWREGSRPQQRCGRDPARSSDSDRRRLS